jgi:hypothetical protein
VVLAADKGEALAELEDQQPKMLDETALEILLDHIRAKAAWSRALPIRCFSSARSAR